MKPVFFALALFAATSVSAQKFEIGINGGVGFNTVPSSLAAEFGGLHSSNLSLAASVKALYNRKKWQFGVSVDYAELSYKSVRYFPFYLPPYPGATPSGEQVTTPIAKPAIPFKVLVNRQIAFRRLKIYAGISAGYVLITNSQYSYGNNELTDKHSGSGWTAGLQIGGTYFISKRLGINGEAAANYMSLDANHFHYNLMQFPFTLGLRYKL